MESALAKLARRTEYRTFAAWRTLEAGANFGQAKAQLGHGAAQGVAVDAEFVGRLALVAPVGNKHFAKVLTLEFAHGIFILDTA